MILGPWRRPPPFFHIISPPEYDHFYFDLEDDLRELTRILKENISETSTKDLTIHELNDFPLLLSDYFPMIVKTSVLVFNPPITLSPIIFMFISRIPSDESKVHIEVLSVLWGNRLPILDGSLPLF
ncbi:hypothetical protein Tco_1535339, partial [Tanacetum coccineum]